MYSSDFMSTCVCLCVLNISKRYKRMLMKFFGEVERGLRRNRLHFGGNPDSFVDPGSFSRILCH